jgi:hypothetical protein
MSLEGKWLELQIIILTKKKKKKVRIRKTNTTYFFSYPEAKNGMNINGGLCCPIPV